MKYNLGLRGGASDGLAYSQLIKEIDEKNIEFDIISGASAGSLFGSMIACGYKFNQIKEIMKEITGDEYMIAQEKVETSKNPFSKVFNGIRFLIAKNKVAKSMQDQLKKYLSWDKLKCDTFYSCVVPLDILGKYAGDNDDFNFVDIFKAIKGKGDFKRIAVEGVGPWYISNKGIFIFDILSCKLVKISDTIVPMWIAVYSSFWNPVLPDVLIKYEREILGKKFGYTMKPFDGGIANNEGNLVFPDKNFIQVLCDKEAVEGKTTCLSDFYYEFNRPDRDKVFEVFPAVKKRGFFAFYNENVDANFNSNTKATNIFKV